uniref:Uncharacterized protein n=1 Tax=Arundo donax TaxID=35708 RepID=A0A0A9EJU2_ARUDO
MQIEATSALNKRKHQEEKLPHESYATYGSITLIYAESIIHNFCLLIFSFQ